VGATVVGVEPPGSDVGTGVVSVTGGGVVAVVATVVLVDVDETTAVPEGRSATSVGWPTSPTARVAATTASAVASNQPPMSSTRRRTPLACPAVAVILIVEDDPRIRERLAEVLGRRGHAVRSASTGMAGLQVVVDEPPDAVVLDLGLPDVSGREVLRMIRAVSAVPIVVATADDDERSIVESLDAGADDYVVKPFSGEQLDARLRAVLRRSGAGATSPGILRVGAIEIDVDGREARLDGEQLSLSRKEFDLLHHLARNVGRVVTRRELLAEVWQQPFGGADKTLDVHLSWLRRKLGETAAHPRYLHTARGVGVRLVEPDE
jgi:two-component system, OmpR family, KDP operon response regulator KdpE